VPTTLWSYAYVETARAHGAISGYSDGTFRPNSDITRAQLAKMIVTAAGWPLTAPARPSFTDVPATHWAYSFVETARARTVIGGYSDGTFRPNNAATRAQLSKMLDTALSTP
jgi:amidase